MSEHGLTPEELKRQYSIEIKKSSTFKTLGVSEQAAIEYLSSPEGDRLLQILSEAAPNASQDEIAERAIGQIKSGRDLPRMEIINEPLVKIVPAGVQDKSLPYTPYFAKESEFQDALAKGHNLHDRFGLPIKSEGAVYDVYRIDPKGPTEVFVSEVAPTSELNGRVTHAGGATQYLVPNRGLFTQATHFTSLGNDLALHQERVVSKRLGAPIAALAAESAAARGLRPGLGAAAKGLSAAGVVISAIDAADTLHDVSRLRAQGNATAAEDRVTRFATQNLGGWAGAATFAGIGATAGVESGPGLLVTGAIGGIVGAVAGDRIADWMRDYKINHQQDRQGNTWTFDPEHPQQGWTPAAPLPGMPRTADPALADLLNCKASNKSIELALGAPPHNRDPYTLPANAHDTRSLRDSPWTRNPETQEWTRNVAVGLIDRTMEYERELATPQRAAELERQSQAIIAQNAAHTPAAMAAQYQAAYEQNGWSRHGVMPAVVQDAARHPGRVVGSNGDLYERAANGQWTHDGIVLDSQAKGNLKHELDATYQRQQGEHHIETPATAASPREPAAPLPGIGAPLDAHAPPPIDPIRDNARFLRELTGAPAPQAPGASGLPDYLRIHQSPTQVKAATAVASKTALGNPLGELIARGEGDYNAYNRGTLNGKLLPANQSIDFTQTSIAEIQRRQDLPRTDPDRVFAVGKYQVIPQTMSETVSALNLDTSQKFSADMQERMFADYLIKEKRPDIYRYIADEPGATLHAAQKGAALEWASVEDPDTPGSVYKPYAQHGNRMSTSAAQIGTALNEMRDTYQTSRDKGLSPDQAWRATIHMGPGSFASPTRDALADGVLRQGEHGTEVRALQENLSRLGITDGQGRALVADGDFGKRTQEAVGAFQRQRGLPVDGAAGPRTLEAVREGAKVSKPSDLQRHKAEREVPTYDALAARPEVPQSARADFSLRDTAALHASLHPQQSNMDALRTTYAAAAPSTQTQTQTPNDASMAPASPPRAADMPDYTMGLGAGATPPAPLREPAAPQAATPVSNPLQLGDRSPQVWTLQDQLIRSGVNQHLPNPVQANGEFDQATQCAVMSFQLRQGLAPTGIADGTTREAVQQQADRTRAQEAPAMSTPQVEPMPLSAALMAAPYYDSPSQAQAPVPAAPRAEPDASHAAQLAQQQQLVMEQQRMAQLEQDKRERADREEREEGHTPSRSPEQIPFSHPDHPRHTLYADVQKHTRAAGYTFDEDRLSQITQHAAHGDMQPGKPWTMVQMHSDGKQLCIMDTTGSRAMIDISQPAPPAEQTVSKQGAQDHVNAQALDQFMQSRQNQQSVGPVLG